MIIKTIKTSNTYNHFRISKLFSRIRACAHRFFPRFLRFIGFSSFPVRIHTAFKLKTKEAFKEYSNLFMKRSPSEIIIYFNIIRRFRKRIFIYASIKCNEHFLFQQSISSKYISIYSFKTF